MKRTLIWCVLSMVMILSGCGKSDAEKSDQGFETGLSFKDFTEQMNPADQTALGIKTFWEEQTGRRVTWEGEVVDVRDGRDRVEVQIRNNSRPTYRGYNIVLVCYDVAAAAKLKKSEKIKFRGMPSRYKEHRGNVLVITLAEGEILE